MTAQAAGTIPPTEQALMRGTAAIAELATLLD